MLKKENISFISGEKIQMLCDHFIGTEKSFKHCKYLKNENKLIDIKNINEPIDNKSLIFCYTHLIRDIHYLIKKLLFLKNPFILIFHNSDQGFSEKHLLLFQKVPNIKHIYTQNMKVVHPKLHPLPIGIANSQWRHGNIEIIKNVYNTDIEKTNDIFFNFNIGTNRSKRNKCFNEISKLNIKWVKNMDFLNYLKNLKSYKYCICPEGNGVDTHRFWECLYLGVIPICKRNILVEYYSKKFNIVLLNEWKDLNVKEILNNYDKNKIEKNNNLLDFNKLAENILNNKN